MCGLRALRIIPYYQSVVNRLGVCIRCVHYVVLTCPMLTGSYVYACVVLLWASYCSVRRVATPVPAAPYLNTHNSHKCLH
jgi:hypothetical protein